MFAPLVCVILVAVVDDDPITIVAAEVVDVVDAVSISDVVSQEPQWQPCASLSPKGPCTILESATPHAVSPHLRCFPFALLNII